MRSVALSLRNRLGRSPKDADRRGGFTVLAAAGLVASIAMTALSVDLGMIAYMKTRLQNAADAAALAAAQEISASVHSVAEHGGNAGDANSIAEGAARAMAERVARLNGVYVDPQRDVQFGKRVYNEQSGQFEVHWNQTPYNVVRVTPRRDNPNPSAPDAELDLFFAPIFGIGSHGLIASAAGYVEARDLVMVLDYTASMNDDSTFAGISYLGRSAVEANMLDIYGALELDLPELPDVPEYVSVSGKASGGPTVTVTFKGNNVTATSPSNITSVKLYFDNGATKTVSANAKTVNAAGSGSTAKRYVTRADVTSGGKTASIHFNNTNIKQAFGLDDVSYPYPGGSWDEFISYVLTYSHYNLAYGIDWLGDYEWKFGKLMLVQYLLDYRYGGNDTPDLWKTPHYPFQAMKEGASLFCQFLEDLEFGDHLGLVTYDESSRVEDKLFMPSEGVNVDISSKPITENYAAIDTIQRHKQAGHYSTYTGIGFGISKAVDLIQDHGRYGARPTIFVMTDGNANLAPPDWEVPDDWSFDDLTDFDGDGDADYTTNDINKLYAFYEAKRAIDLGYMVHTLSVGGNSDPDLMKAIAFASGGEFINVPGGTSIAQIEAEVELAFTRIAGNVPPAKLLFERD